MFKIKAVILYVIIASYAHYIKLNITIRISTVYLTFVRDERTLIILKKSS